VYNNPFKGIRKHVENERATSKTKRKHTIEKIQITPFHAEKFPVVLRKADLTSVLAMKHFGPSFRRIFIASSRRTYCSEYSSDEMFALTLALEVFGYDKWKIVLHLDEFFFRTRPKG
jgi:hypothetical protein